METKYKQASNNYYYLDFSIFRFLFTFHLLLLFCKLTTNIFKHCAILTYRLFAAVLDNPTNICMSCKIFDFEMCANGYTTIDKLFLSTLTVTLHTTHIMQH